MLPVFGIAAGLTDARLAEQVRSFGENRPVRGYTVLCLWREQLDIDGLALPLLTSPSQEEIVITILADSIDMADDAADWRFLSRSLHPRQQCTTQPQNTAACSLYLVLHDSIPVIKVDSTHLSSTSCG